MGHQVVVVVSAMSGETNKLINLAKELMAEPDPRELDMIVSTGEQVTVGMTALALIELGIKAKSYTGAQVKILTDDAYTKARILNIDQVNLKPTWTPVTFAWWQASRVWTHKATSPP